MELNLVRTVESINYFINILNQTNSLTYGREDNISNEEYIDQTKEGWKNVIIDGKINPLYGLNASD